MKCSNDTAPLDYGTWFTWHCTTIILPAPSVLDTRKVLKSHGAEGRKNSPMSRRVSRKKNLTEVLTIHQLDMKCQLAKRTSEHLPSLQYT